MTILTELLPEFIFNYFNISAPLSDLLRRNHPKKVEWSAKCKKFFQGVKQLLCTDPVLRCPDFFQGVYSPNKCL